MNDCLASDRKNLSQQVVLLSVPLQKVAIKSAQLLIQLLFFFRFEIDRVKGNHHFKDSLRQRELILDVFPFDCRHRHGFGNKA
jgi:hypothetical protein